MILGCFLRDHSLKLSQPRVCNERSKDRCQVAQCNERVVDGCRQVVIPLQEILEIQNEHRCRKKNKMMGYKLKSGLGK